MTPSIFFTIKSYLGGLLRAGTFAVHVKDEEVYFGITNKKTVKIYPVSNDNIAVISVNGQSGVVVLTAALIGAASELHTHDGRYYTEAESNSRYLGKTAKASDSDKLDGHDSGYFVKANDSGWLTATLMNGWEVYDENIAYRLDSVGILHFKGTARYGALNAAIFQLPTAFRPTRNISIVVLMRSAFGRLNINTNGYVIPSGDEEQAYDDDGEPTGEIIEVGYLSLESNFIL